jgi:acetyl esterase/lipase
VESHRCEDRPRREGLMAENPLVHIPRAWPMLNRANALRRRVVGQLRSFDVIQWDGTPYGKHRSQAMHIQELNDLCPRDGWPAILMIHGGGWVQGSREDFAHIAPLFAKRGVMACAMDYRLAPDDPWPAQLEDVLLALDFLRSQQVDPKRIALWGHSAGGQLALLAGMERPSQIRCVVATAAPTDLSRCPEDLWREAFTREQLESVSPMHQSGADLPTTLLVHGQLDRRVPIEQARAFAGERSEEVSLMELRDGDHGLRWPPVSAWRTRRKAIDWTIEQLDMPSRGSKWKRRKKGKR